MGAEDELKIGILTKRAQQIKSLSRPNYKERVFVLTPSKLSYYEGSLAQRGKMKGSFDLSTITFVGLISDSALQGTDTFLIIHDECYLYCCAKNQEECIEWVQAIKQACYDVGIYQQLQHKFHSKLYLRGKWQCCDATQKTAEGCTVADNEGMQLLGYNHHNSSINTESYKYSSSGSTSSFSPVKPTFKPRKACHSDRGEFSSIPSGSCELNRDKFIINNHLDVENKALPISPMNSYHKALPKLPISSQNNNFEHFVKSPSKIDQCLHHFSNQDGESNTVPSASVTQPAVNPSSTTGHRRVTALYDYEPIEKDDIPLEAGIEYLVIDDSRPHWWIVRNDCGTEGFVPSNYVAENRIKQDDLQEKSWFQPDMSRQQAEYLLLKDGLEGTFVVRKSTHESVIYSLSVLSRCGKPTSPPTIRHYHIKQDVDGRYFLSPKHVQNSILDLINYHKHNAGGLVTRLRQAPDYLLKEPSNPLFLGSDWEMRWEDLKMIKKLGSGQFGVVNLATFKGKTEVAVKIMKQNAMREASFIEEAEVMTKLRHRNLVELYGVVIHKRPICIVTEYMEEGCLLDYIREQPSIVEHPDILLDISCQVCDGMKYLESKNVIHRDLAARNCLVGKNLLVKVGDFGLARFVLDDEYTSSVGSKFPIKWSAPEVLNYTKFSSKSDVWAFGVLMWELFTGGKIPYPSLTNSEVVTKVSQGVRLERPSNCPHDVFTVMKRTWHEEPDLRPSFSDLMDILLDIIDNINANNVPPGLWQGS